MSSLHERLARARTAGVLPQSAPREPDQRQLHRSRPDPLAELRQKVHRALVEALGPRLYDTEMSSDQLHDKVREMLQRALEEEETPLTRDERRRLVSEKSFAELERAIGEVAGSAAAGDEEINS